MKQTHRRPVGSNIGLLVLFLCCISLAILSYVGYQALDPIQRQRREQQARSEAAAAQLAQQQEAFTWERQQRIELALGWIDYSTVAFFKLLPVIVVAGGLGLGAWYLIDRYRLSRRLVWADAAGRLPMPRVEVERNSRPAQATIAAYHTTALAAAQRPVLPTSLHYAPKLSTDRQQPLEPTEQLPAVAESLPAGKVDLLDQLGGWQPSLSSILLALGPGGTPYRVHARDLCHVALAGATNGGKSNIMRLLLSQILAVGGQVVLADPHYTPYDPESGDDWRPIAGKLHLAPAVNAADIKQLLTWLAVDELKRRKELRAASQPVGRPIFLAIDELPSIIDELPQTPKLLGILLREARKYNIFLIGASQDFLVKTIGGSGAVRDCYRTAFYVGGDAQTARVLLDVRGTVDDGTLGQGVAMLRSKATPTAQLVKVPYASNDALYRLLEPVRDATTDPTSTTVTIEPTDSWREVGREVGSTQPLPADYTALSPRHERVRALLREKRTQNEILTEVWGLKTTSGRAYQVAADEYRAIIAELVR